MSDWSAGESARRRRPRSGRQSHGGGYDYYRGSSSTAPTTPQRSVASPDEHAGRRRDRPSTGEPPRSGSSGRKKKRRWPRRIGIALAVVLLLVTGLVIYTDTSLQRTPALADYPGRVADTPGTNWLLVGSDSRQGLDPARREELSAGDAGGRRTDTMMLVHIPAGGGQPSLISLPRDSWVPIPGHGSNKLNAAFSFGGPRLLARTVETVTGVHLDHYAEIGLGGFAGLVDAVSGVEMCLDEPLRDPKAGLNLSAGCQQLDGAQALGFVRTRAFAEGDLQRIENQRKFLGALVDKASSPATLLNPFRLFPLITAAGETFLVDSSDHVWNLAWLAMAMGDISGKQGVTTTVPIARFITVDGQSAIKWNTDQALRMFEAIAQDEPIPPEVLPD
ncbi:LCP family protein [Halosaccharopolyspora lacisalsi]|uniref:LCP family protein n=1 Tax=Halosaccharopolyspora lacisalsi TaxID=1000566 RepID=UPI0015F84FFC